MMKLIKKKKHTVAICIAQTHDVGNNTLANGTTKRIK